MLVEIKKVDETYIKIIADRSIERELSEYFSFFVPGYKFMEAYKNGGWDGKIRLFNQNTSQILFGLMREVVKFSREREYDITIDKQCRPVKIPDFTDFIDGLDIRAGNGDQITPYDYQIDSAIDVVKNNRGLILSPTGSGKSLIVYMIIRVLMKYVGGKILIVVPSTSLVEQITSDFNDYSGQDQSFDVNCISKVYGGRKDISGQVVISTYQSIYKNDSEYFNQFSAIIVDEAHQAKAKSIMDILQNSTHVPFKIGLTGTIEDSKTHHLTLQGLFGPIVKTRKTIELMHDDVLTSIKIKCVHIKHSPDDKKIAAKATYQEEVKMVTRNHYRDILLCNMAMQQTGNTVMFFNFVDHHGRRLFELMEHIAGDDAHVFFVSGETPTPERERIRKFVDEADKKCIIVASYGVFSTGVNIKSLQCGIFMHPYKAKIKNLQSIGRLLRKSDGKDVSTLIDVWDDFGNGKTHNALGKHFIERLRLYKNEGFEFTIQKFQMPEFVERVKKSSNMATIAEKFDIFYDQVRHDILNKK